MDMTHVWKRDELCSQVGINPIEFSAQAIESAAHDLLIDAMGVQSVSEALQLYRMAKDLRLRMERLEAVCLDKADALCGGD